MVKRLQRRRKKKICFKAPCGLIWLYLIRLSVDPVMRVFVLARKRLEHPLYTTQSTAAGTKTVRCALHRCSRDTRQRRINRSTLWETIGTCFHISPKGGATLVTISFEPRLNNLSLHSHTVGCSIRQQTVPSALDRQACPVVHLQTLNERPFGRLKRVVSTVARPNKKGKKKIVDNRRATASRDV